MPPNGTRGVVGNCGAVGLARRGGTKKGVEKLRDDARLDVAHDEDHAGAAIVVGPAFQPGSRVHEVLDRVNQDRRIGVVGKLHHTLDSQQARPVQRTHQFHEHLEGADRNGLRRGKRKRPDVSVMAIGIMPVVGAQY
jgi:hypothetical protein